MANSNPYKARLAKAKARLAEVDPETIDAAKKALWLVLCDGLSRLEALGEGSTDEYSKISTAVTSAAREYRQLTEATELEARIEAMERAAGERKGFTYVGARA